jgi:SDR family mycofactocin-dependent oxidoreductase
MGDLDGKVAFITGVARGQGRSHAIRLAEEGADIIGLDICQDMETVPYPLATKADLEATRAEVERLGRRMVSAVGDVRDVAAIEQVVRAGVAELGGIDIVVANAGICPIGSDAPAYDAFLEVIDVNLTGVWNTVRAAAPILIEQGRGGSIILTSSTAGLKGLGGGSGGGEGYTASKHAVVGLMRTWATQYGQHNIRVNSVHPSGVATPMIINDAMLAFRREREEQGDTHVSNLLPVELVESIDVSNAIAWLASDAARYVTGVTLPVDGGQAAR